MRFADYSTGKPYAKGPAVVFWDGVYWLYYSLPPHPDAGRTGWAIGVARSPDGEAWEKVGEVVLDGRVHLFYQTYGNGARDAICHAVSDDGLRFNRSPTNPVFAPTGDWNNGRAIDADVIADGDRLLLYFATRDPTGRVQKLGVAGAPLASDFGRGQWMQSCQESILEPALPWEQDCIEAPAVCRRDGRLYLFYAGADNNAPQQIGCAVSDDGLTWERLGDQPFLPNGGPGDWNASESGHPFVFTDAAGNTTLFFQGNNDGGRTWYLSKVGIGWRDGRPFVRL